MTESERSAHVETLRTLKATLCDPDSCGKTDDCPALAAAILALTAPESKPGELADYLESPPPAPALPADAELSRLRSDLAAAREEAGRLRENLDSHKAHIQSLYAAMGFDFLEVRSEAQAVVRAMELQEVPKLRSERAALLRVARATLGIMERCDACHGAADVDHSCGAAKGKWLMAYSSLPPALREEIGRGE